MNTTDKPRFALMLTALADLHDKEVTDTKLRAYWTALSDLDIAGVVAAGEKLMRASKFMPKPVEFRELVNGTDNLAAADAWELVPKLAANSCAAKHPDPVAERVVAQLGGWKRLGQQDADQLGTWTRKEFVALYAELLKAPQHRQLVAPEDADRKVLEAVAKVVEGGD